jgi:hypothetical protein
MHVRLTIHPGTPESPDRSHRPPNRVAAPARRSPESTYRAPSVLHLQSGPLRKLAWILGLR